jgi:hypothetical protein
MEEDWSTELTKSNIGERGKLRIANQHFIIIWQDSSNSTYSSSVNEQP